MLMVPSREPRKSATRKERLVGPPGIARVASPFEPRKSKRVVEVLENCNVYGPTAFAMLVEFWLVVLDPPSDRNIACDGAAGALVLLQSMAMMLSPSAPKARSYPTPSYQVAREPMVASSSMCTCAVPPLPTI